MCGCPEGHHTIYCPARPEPEGLEAEAMEPFHGPGPLMRMHVEELEAMLARPPADDAISRAVDWEPTGAADDLDPAPAEPEEDYGPLDAIHPAELHRLDPTRIRHNLTNRAPRGTQALRYELIREKGIELSILMSQLAPESNELVRAVDLVDDAVRLAIAAIARNEP